MEQRFVAWASLARSFELRQLLEGGCERLLDHVGLREAAAQPGGELAVHVRTQPRRVSLEELAERLLVAALGSGNEVVVTRAVIHRAQQDCGFFGPSRTGPSDSAPKRH